MLDVQAYLYQKFFNVVHSFSHEAEKELRSCHGKLHKIRIRAVAGLVAAISSTCRYVYKS